MQIHWIAALFAVLLSTLALPTNANHADPARYPPNTPRDHFIASPSGAPHEFRSCPSIPGSGLVGVIVGIRHDRNFLRCASFLETDDGYKFSDGHRSGPRDGQLPDRQWPADGFPAQAAYSGPSMHWCGPNAVMVSYRASTNEFFCREIIAGPHQLNVLLVDGPQPWVSPGHFRAGNYNNDFGAPGPSSGTLHVCPQGYVLVGMHHDANIFLCGKLIDR